ncbi:DUF11 domain-containing protein [Desulfosudis oleivorans]|uniref:Conserved repeat domain n=1 Tax=Desulfosudis oleivorans (strain DSM 6200 / JCM 39069 / Hxd3) TaxID=96561 RepID=A9A0N7_DESOH|nr:DUF11 domain-containing protein [Desulfosudis oleivorans]ABW69054.1 conserved repeat domain [Desulfosudis oleivorans Hxd3]
MNFDQKFFGKNKRAGLRIRLLVLLFLCFPLFLPLPALAAGTPAGSIIPSQAFVTYTVGPVSGFTKSSNIASFTVAEVLDVTLSWQDAAPVPVIAGDINRVLSFQVTNTGNGQDRYGLAIDTALSGDNFDPSFTTLVLDANGNGIYEPAVDTVYTPGVNDPVLAADASLAVFVLCDIPSGLDADDTGDIRLTATSATGNGAPTGTIIAGAGDGGTDAVVGFSRAAADAVGTYRAAVLSVAKSAVVADPYGGDHVVPGAIITYTIVVSVSGTGAAAMGATLEDPIPDNSEYLPGSITLNGTGLTDAADADAGDMGQTTANTVTVFLGNLIAGSPDQTITFQVRVTDPT